MAHSRFFRSLLAGCLLAAACTSDDNGGTEPGPDPAIALALSASSASVDRGATTSFQAVLTRSGGFTGDVALTVEGVPGGVTAVVSDVVTTGGVTVATVGVQVGETAATGVHDLTVRATGAGVSPATAPFALTVTPGDIVVVDFTRCAVQPLWFAAQSGEGQWNRVTGDNSVFRFRVGADRGAWAWVRQLPSGNLFVLVQFQTRTELTGEPVVICPFVENTKAVTGTLAGLGAADLGRISLGGSGANLSGADGSSLPFELANVQDGPMDLVASRRPAPGQPGGGMPRLVIRRDLNLAPQGSLGVVDLAGAESFEAASATITVGGAPGGTTVSHQMAYLTGPYCWFHQIQPFSPVEPPTFTAYGVPTARQRPSDLHGVSLSTFVDPNLILSVSEYVTALADRTVSFGSQPPPPDLTVLPGPYKRVQAAFALPGDYNQASIFYTTDTRTLAMFASAGWAGGAANVTLVPPDFSGVEGWNNAWAPPANQNTFWIGTVLRQEWTANDYCPVGRHVAATRSGGI